MSTDSYLELDFQDESSRFNMDRRDFIKIAGSGIILLFSIGDLSLLAQEVRTRGPRHSLPTDFNAFLRIGEDGRIACYTGKIEMGQGVITSLAQELADELDAPLDSVDMVMGDTELCPWDAGTFGSLTTRAFGPALRAAGAEARQVLLELASEKLKAPTDKLVTENGFLSLTGKRAQRITYA